MDKKTIIIIAVIIGIFLLFSGKKFTGAITTIDCTNVEDGNYKGSGKWLVLDGQGYSYATFYTSWSTAGKTKVGETIEGYGIYYYSTTRIIINQGDHPIYEEDNSVSCGGACDTLKQNALNAIVEWANCGG